METTESSEGGIVRKSVIISSEHVSNDTIESSENKGIAGTHTIVSSEHVSNDTTESPSE